MFRTDELHESWKVNTLNPVREEMVKDKTLKFISKEQLPSSNHGFEKFCHYGLETIGHTLENLS